MGVSSGEDGSLVCSDMDLSGGMNYSLSDDDRFKPFHSSATQKANGSCPLYPSSCITEGDFNTIFLSLVQRHNLTYASQSDILKLFSMLLPSPGRIPSSSHVLIGKFVNFAEDTIVQHFCGACT